MKKGKRYKRTNKRLINFLWFYIIISTLLISAYTFSSYVAKVEQEGVMKIAKFNVKVNDKDILENKEFIVNLNSNSNAYNEKLFPGTSGYFNLEINPAGTEVSLEYEFRFSLEELNKNFKLLYFTIDSDETHYDINDNIVKGDLLLPSDNTSFTDEQKTNLKVYWSWDEQEDIYNPDISSLNYKNIRLLATVKQVVK